MRRIEYGSAFKKDYKRMMKRGAALQKLNAVLNLLMNDVPLPARNRPHMLSREWRGFWECHIESDWLLIYDLMILMTPPCWRFTARAPIPICLNNAAGFLP